MIMVMVKGQVGLARKSAGMGWDASGKREREEIERQKLFFTFLGVS